MPAGIAFSRDGKQVYVAFSRNNTLAVIDAETRQVAREVEVGIAPFSVAVAAARGRIYVSNRGGRRPTAKDTTAPSSGTAVATDPVTGLDDHRDAVRGGSRDLVGARAGHRAGAVAHVVERGREAAGGRERALRHGHDRRDRQGNDHGGQDSLPSPRRRWAASRFRRLFTPDAKTLYVACGGNNAIAAVRRNGSGWKVAGALPTAWFPSAIALDAEGGLRILNIKGVGNTDNKKGGFNSRQYEGSLERIPAPTPLQLESGAREVKAANMPMYEPAGGVANLSSLGIQHVFLIVKENRTYDQVFGDMAKGNGDPKLAIYGKETTPNHHALADKYVLLDNFYTGGAIASSKSAIARLVPSAVRMRQ